MELQDTSPSTRRTSMQCTFIGEEVAEQMQPERLRQPHSCRIHHLRRKHQKIGQCLRQASAACWTDRQCRLKL